MFAGQFANAIDLSTAALQTTIALHNSERQCMISITLIVQQYNVIHNNISVLFKCVLF